MQLLNKAVIYYDTSCDTSAFQSITLEQGKKLEQSFVCKENHMDGISLKLRQMEFWTRAR